MTSLPRAVHVLAFPDVQLLDVTGPLQVFASANVFAHERGLPPPYAPSVVSASPSPVLSSAGLGLACEPLPQQSETLIVAGGRGVYAALQDRDLVKWLRQHAAHCSRVASVCTGAFLLAEAGLLQGRRAVTHWSNCSELQRRHPDVQVEPDPIFIQDGRIWTSAGVTAGIDMALAMVEQDLGRAIALDVARDLVVFMKRPGGQAQFSAALTLQSADDQFGELHAWIAEHLHRDLSVAVLAERAGMSERSFIRHYRARTGNTPARAVEQLRTEAALRLLAETDWPLKRIAARCGFGSEETLRRSTLRAIAVTPQAYRARFTSSEQR